MVRRWHRFQDSVLRTRDRELGINLTYNFTANVSGGVQPSVSLRDEVFIDTNTRQERWRLWFHIRATRGVLRLLIRLGVRSILRVSCSLRVRFRCRIVRTVCRGLILRLAIRVGIFVAIRQTCEFFLSGINLNDPRQDRKREFGFSIGLKKII